MHPGKRKWQQDWISGSDGLGVSFLVSNAYAHQRKSAKTYEGRTKHICRHNLGGLMQSAGRSEKRAGQDVSFGVQNEVFTALLDHWKLARPDVVAHDFGGATALRTHLLNKRDYRSLTLIDPVAIGPSGSAFVQAAKNHEEVFAGLAAYIHQAILRAYIGGAAFHKLCEDEMALYVEPWLGDEGQAAFYRQIAQMSDRFTDEIENRFGEMRCPVTILWGQEDEWIPVERGRELARRIPGASFQMVSQTKHLVQYGKCTADVEQ